jgi:hypothetical protein
VGAYIDCEKCGTSVTTDIQGDCDRLKSAGVVFRGQPVDMGTVTAVAFEDTCGNLIQLVQPAV